MNRLENTHRYDDIIDLPHPVSKKHPQMPSEDRAAQFSPFAALTGYERAIREKEMQHEERMMLGRASAGKLMIQNKDNIFFMIKFIRYTKQEICVV